ncbi:MAG: DNA polymerase III subunit delta [Mycobacterium leprae]
MNPHEALSEVKAGKLRPIYLIYGGEPFLADELMHAIREATVVPETADFNYHVFQPGNDQIQQALNMARTEPFFASHRLVVVRDCPVFATRKKQEESDAEEGDEKAPASDEALLSYVKTPAASTCLVFLSEEGVDSRKKVTKALVATGGAVECKALKDQDAIMWAQQRGTFYGKKLADSAARLLVEKVGPDLRLIDTELLKLRDYVGEDRAISAADVDLLVGGVAETEIFRLTEAVMLKERSKALALLAKTLRQVDHPLQVLAALTNRFRQILTVKTLVSRGVGLREGPGLAKMHPYAYEKMAGYVRQFPRTEILSALEKLLAADVAMKTGFDPVLTLQMLVVELMP